MNSLNFQIVEYYKIIFGTCKKVEFIIINSDICSSDKNKQIGLQRVTGRDWKILSIAEGHSYYMEININ